MSSVSLLYIHEVIVQELYIFQTQSCMYFRFHQLFKAKLGLLGDEEEDGYLIAFLLKASLWKWDGCSLWKTFLHSSSLSAKSIPSHCLFTGSVQIGFYLRPPNLIWFVSPDDGGHSVRLHHDLQAAQWSFSWAASQQQLHTGGAREYNNDECELVF